LGTRKGLGVQAVRLSGEASPAMDGSSVDAQDATDDRGRLALFNQFDGTPTPAFEFSSSS
jgi:hypothetical protein